MEGAVVWDLFDVVLEVSTGRVGFGTFFKASKLTPRGQFHRNC